MLPLPPAPPADDTVSADAVSSARSKSRSSTPNSAAQAVRQGPRAALSAMQYRRYPAEAIVRNNKITFDRFLLALVPDALAKQPNVTGTPSSGGFRFGAPGFSFTEHHDPRAEA